MLQEAGSTTDRSQACHTKSHNGSVHSNSESESVDSGVSRSGSQESMELVYERGSSELSTCSIATELEKVDESEMDENDPLQVAKGEDCPNYPESVGLQAIRGFYCLLINYRRAAKLQANMKT